MKKTALLATLSLIGVAHAYEAKLTKGQGVPTLDAMLEKARQDTGVNFEAGNFTLIEQRELATSNYTFYVQTSQMIPVAETGIRIWTDKKTGEMILGEMNLDEQHKKEESKIAANFKKAHFSAAALKSQQLANAIQEIVAKEVETHATDARILGVKSRDMWVKGDLVRQVEVRGRRGIHTVRVSLLKNQVLSNHYMEFPQAEALTSINANIYPIYEEVEATNEMLNYETRELKYIKTDIPDGGENPLAGLGNLKYTEDRYNPVLAETEIGRQYNIWSEASIRKQVEQMIKGFPVVPNTLENGMLLQGKFATIQIHPNAKTAFPGINFPLKPSVNHLLAWQVVDGHYEGKPMAGLYGQPIKSPDDLLKRIPFRSPDHDPTKYINSGVDEGQVYFAITTLMESLDEMGFRDPELSTKAFHAFLYDPDIGMRDNAYYTDNTINFTTYSKKMPNLARDNSTIWHELGHGVMERLMGSFLIFGDTHGGYGGLSEGMADFVAKLVVEHQTNGNDFPGKYDFRIMNNTGFYLTNEFHDEGEAYGGAMADILAAAVARDGRQGLFNITDITLEAMRLTRNHPALTAAKWFDHMVYADALGSETRAAGIYKDIMIDVLSKRNFSFDPSFTPAKMVVTSKDGVLTATSVASREKPIKACDVSGKASFPLKMAVTAGDSKFLKFPVTVKIDYKVGALQGALKWDGEENNPTVYTINNEQEILDIPLAVSTTECDLVNQPNGTCKDYAYIRVYNQDSKKPVAKKRFYLVVDPKDTTCAKN